MLSLSKHARFAGLLALSACAKPESDNLAGERIACALDGASAFADDCTVERSGLQFVVHRPDGGFHRFEAASDTGITSVPKGLSTADGAEGLQVTPLADGRMELAIGADRYRLRVDFLVSN